MGKDAFRCVTVSDFNLENFNAYLRQTEGEPRLDVIETPYGQVHQVLMDGNADYWKRRPDGVFIWTRPQAVIPSFAQAAKYEAVDHDQVLDEVSAYADSLLALGKHTGMVVVASWTIPSHERGPKLMEMKNGIGLSNLLMRMNLRLCDRLGEESGFYVLNTQNWVEASRRTFPPKSWYMAKLAFGNDVFKEAAQNFKATITSILGQTRKLIVLDLDDTLWGGTVGEIGWEHVTLGGHDPIGEALVDFQRALKVLTRRGVLLGIVSKNEESIALETIEKHPEMVLRLDDFAGWRINWQDKAQNMVDLVSDLNLGLQSVVFIDDNPFERARVRDSLPEVHVPEWPEDKTLYRKSLLEMRCFDTPSINIEDRERTKLYTIERERRELRHSVQSLDEWLESLETTVQAEPLNKANLGRATQLLNKTNQMNMATRRMSEKELEDWAVADSHCFLTFRVADKLGNLGLTGIISLAQEGGCGHIVDFLLSCRVIGREIEETMVAVAFRHAQILDLELVCARYIPTRKNKPCLEFWQRSGFQPNPADPHVFSLPTDAVYTIPHNIVLKKL